MMGPRNIPANLAPLCWAIMVDGLVVMYLAAALATGGKVANCDHIVAQKVVLQREWKARDYRVALLGWRLLWLSCLSSLSVNRLIQLLFFLFDIHDCGDVSKQKWERRESEYMVRDASS